MGRPRISTTGDDSGLAEYEEEQERSTNITNLKKTHKGKNDFHKHFYADVAAFDSSEEEECAWVINNLPQVEWWVRNIANDEHAYRFPKAGCDFYPEFVVLLKDGRRLIVEYKGHVYKTNDDSREKNMVAELAAKASKGRLLYLMAVARDDAGRSVEGQLKASIEGLASGEP